MEYRYTFCSRWIRVYRRAALGFARMGKKGMIQLIISDLKKSPTRFFDDMPYSAHGTREAEETVKVKAKGEVHGILLL